MNNRNRTVPNCSHICNRIRRDLQFRIHTSWLSSDVGKFGGANCHLWFGGVVLPGHLLSYLLVFLLLSLGLTQCQGCGSGPFCRIRKNFHRILLWLCKVPTYYKQRHNFKK